MIRQATAAFTSSASTSGWKDAKADKLLPVPELAELLAKYAKPLEVDKVLKLQADVDEVKDIMKKNIDAMLDRVF